MVPKPNQIYQHFKGGLYKIVTTAQHTETEEILVIYQALYGDFKVYARPLSMFEEEVDRKKYPKAVQRYRFQRVEQMVEAVQKEQIQEAARLEKSQEAERSEVSPKTDKPEKIQEPDQSASAQELERIEKSLDVQRKKGLERAAMFLQWEESQEGLLEEEQEDRSILEAKDSIDPMLEAYLDADSCRERLNILRGMRHRITENMLLTMAVVIDFELPEGNLEQKYFALQDCLMTKEKYECSRLL